MAGRLLQLVARAGLAILLIANGPANVYAHALKAGGPCTAVTAEPDEHDANEAKPAARRCCCKHRNACPTSEPGQEPRSSEPKPAPRQSGGPEGEQDSTCQVQADCPCCPGCPHCPAGCCVCGVCKPSNLHATPHFVLDVACLGSSLIELSLFRPVTPPSELLQVPRV